MVTVVVLITIGLCLVAAAQDEQRAAAPGAAVDDVARSGQSESAQLQRLLRYVECILASITSGVIVVDVMGRVTLINQEAETILHCRPEQVLGHGIYEFPSLMSLLSLINQVRSSSPPWARSSRQYELRFTNFIGDRIPLGVSVNVLMDEGGSVLGYVLVCKDLTESRAIRADMEHARKLSALGTMASGVAHNFNNILATILGRAQMLIRFPTSPERTSEGLHIIEKAALDGAATVKRISDFAKKRPSEQEFKDVDLREVVTDVVAFTRGRWHDDATQRGLEYEVTTDLTATRPVKGSSSELREVLINLIFNAIDAMPNGGAIVIRTEGDLRHARVVIRDNGCGIPEEIRGRIFDPFFTTKGRNGSGLGLAESMSIIQRHRGRIQCDSETGKGTTFTIEFPVGAFPTWRPTQLPAESQG